MHSSSTYRLLLATTLALLVQAGSSFAQESQMTISLNGSHIINGVTTGLTGLTREAASGMIIGSHGPGPGHPDGGVSATARPGRVAVRAESYGSYSGPAPEIYSLGTYNGGAHASFYDHLTITGRYGNVVPDIVHIRITWRTTGNCSYEDPDVNWGGHGNYSVGNSSHTVAGAKGRGQYGPPIFTSGTSSGSMVFTEEKLTAPAGFLLAAEAHAEASNGPYIDQDAGGGYAHASGHSSMEVMGIEVRNVENGGLLAVNVTGASGHVYPVAQPPVPGLPPTALHVTAHHISQEGGAGMLSFASEAGVTYRVKASNDMGRTDPWEVLSTLTGQPGVTLATFIDPKAQIQPARFFIIERD